MLKLANRNKHYMQLCWLVPNLEVAINYWVKTAGAGPFFVFDDVHFDDSYYRGQPQDIAAHCAAIGYLGDMQIELVMPIGNEPGIWQDVAVTGKSAGQILIHHAALYCEDYDIQVAAYLEVGAEMAFEGLMMGAKTCYIDTLNELGFMTEIITAHPIAEQVFRSMHQASKCWDGSNPIRSLA